mgnify:CR=1 FL=1
MWQNCVIEHREKDWQKLIVITILLVVELATPTGQFSPNSSQRQPTNELNFAQCTDDVIFEVILLDKLNQCCSLSIDLVYYWS